MQKYVCEKCRKEIASRDLYEIHKSAYFNNEELGLCF